MVDERSRWLHKIMALIFSTIIMSVFTALVIVPPEEMEGGIVAFCMFNFACIYIFIGLPISFLLDYIAAKWHPKPSLQQYIVEAVVYSVGGFLISAFLFQWLFDIFPFNIIFDYVFETRFIGVNVIGMLSGLLFLMFEKFSMKTIDRLHTRSMSR